MNFNLVRNSALLAQKIINTVPILSLVDKRLTNNAEEYETPIFIFGAPRTGSTLLLQLLLAKYRFSYISNFASLFYKSPVSAALVASKMFKPHDFTNLKSDYGFINGMNAPSEAGKLVDFWFDRNVETAKKNMKKLSEVLNGPFILKNLSLSLQIRHLDENFTNPIFIHIKRKPIYTAQSIILAKRKLQKNENDWFSFDLPEKNELLKKESFEQVVLQIKKIDEHIQEGAKSIEQNRFIEVKYEKLCQDPEKELDRIVAILKKRNLHVFKRQGKIPKVKIAEEIKLPNKEWGRLEKLVDKHFK